MDSGLYLTMAGVLANTSRMAQLVALVLLVLIGLHYGPAFLRKLSGAQKSVAIAGALAIGLTLIALAQATHLEQPLNRWRLLGERMPTDARWQASCIAMSALPHVGFFGFGPGTFRVVFPGYNVGSGRTVPGTWRFLHEDYLQTVLEWGWVGSGSWGLLFFGGMVIAIRSYKKPWAREWTPRRRLLQPFVIVALAGVARQRTLPIPVAIWLPDIVFGIAGVVFLCRMEWPGDSDLLVYPQLQNFTSQVVASRVKRNSSTRPRGAAGSGCRTTES